MAFPTEHHPLVALAPDEAEILRSTRQLVAREIGPRANAVGRVDRFAADNFRLLAQAGLVALSVPPEYGGRGATMLLRVRLMEEIATACSVSAALLAGTDGSVRPIVAGAGEAIRQRLLPAMADGRVQCALALTEPQAGSDLGSLKTVAEPVAGGVRLTGTKKFITRANVADYFVVFARAAGAGAGTRGLQALLVPRDAPGLSVSDDEAKMGWHGLPIAEVRFDSVLVAPKWQLGAANQGMAVAQDALLRARLSHGGIALGRMAGALQVAAQYAAKRRVRGAPLADLQGIQWMLADMGARMEAVRCLVYAAALRYDRGDADTALHASMAKQQATDLSMRVCIDCLQLLGANGYLKAYPLERFVRDAKFNQIGEGTSEIHRNIIGAALVRQAAALPPHPCVPEDAAAFAA